MSGSGGQIRDSYLDLDESTMASRGSTVTRPQRPLSHSYVNSDVSNAPSGSQTGFASDDPPLKGKGSGYVDTSRRPGTVGNEYASVSMSRIAERERQLELASQSAGACGFSQRGSTSTEGDYDIVWDSVKFGKQLKAAMGNSNRDSVASDNIYTEIERVTRSELPVQNSIVCPSELFPPSDQFGRESSTFKPNLSRTRSKSL